MILASHFLLSKSGKAPASTSAHVMWSNFQVKTPTLPNHVAFEGAVAMATEEHFDKKRVPYEGKMIRNPYTGGIYLVENSKLIKQEEVCTATLTLAE
jgi:hypothetical protein